VWLFWLFWAFFFPQKTRNLLQNIIPFFQKEKNSPQFEVSYKFYIKKTLVQGNSTLQFISLNNKLKKEGKMGVFFF
jgi:hypothetical protein